MRGQCKINYQQLHIVSYKESVEWNSRNETLKLNTESQSKLPQNLFDKVIKKLATTLDSLHKFSARPTFNGRSMFILHLIIKQL